MLYKDKDANKVIGEGDKEFDKAVTFVVWFGIICLVVGVILTHYTH